MKTIISLKSLSKINYINIAYFVLFMTYPITVACEILYLRK